MADNNGAGTSGFLSTVWQGIQHPIDTAERILTKTEAAFARAAAPAAPVAHALRHPLNTFAAAKNELEAEAANRFHQSTVGKAFDLATHPKKLEALAEDALKQKITDNLNGSPVGKMALGALGLSGADGNKADDFGDMAKKGLFSLVDLVIGFFKNIFHMFGSQRFDGVMDHLGDSLHAMADNHDNKPATPGLVPAPANS